MTRLTLASRPFLAVNCLLVLVCLGCLVSCQKQPVVELVPGPTDSNAVAMVGEAVMTAEMLRAQLQQRFPAPLARELSLEQKQSVLESWIRSESVYARAQSLGFDQSPELQRQIKNLVVARFLESQLPTAPTGVTDEAVEAWYTANRERFVQPASAHGSLLFIAVPKKTSEDKRAEDRRRAESIWNQARRLAPIDFSKLVARCSDDQASRYRGGDIGWHTAASSTLEPEVRDALLALEGENAIAPLLETGRGFYIVKLLERRDAAPQPFQQVQKSIRQQLSRETARQTERAFYDRMKEGLNVRINQELLESIHLPTQQNAPPALPGTQTARVRTQNEPDAPGQSHSGVADARRP